MPAEANFAHPPHPDGSEATIDYKDLKTHQDARGYFREVLKISEPFGVEGYSNLQHHSLSLNDAPLVLNLPAICWLYVPAGIARLAISQFDTDSNHNPTEIVTLGNDDHLNNRVVKLLTDCRVSFTPLTDCQLIIIFK